MARGCLLLPSGCSRETCDFFVSWEPHNDTVDFHVASMLDSRGVQWSAVAFSEDQDMVTVCRQHPQRSEDKRNIY